MLKHKAELFAIYCVIFFGFVSPLLSENLLALGIRNWFVYEHMQDIYLAFSLVVFFLYVSLNNLARLYSKNTVIHIIFLGFLCIGSLLHGFNITTFFKISLLYLLPIFAYTAGAVYAERYGDHSEIWLLGVMKVVVIFLVISLASYIFAFYQGSVPRVGYSNTIGFALAFMYFQSHSIVLLFLAISAGLLTGKRSSLIGVFILLVFYFGKNGIKAATLYTAVIIFSIILLISTTSADFIASYFHRWTIDTGAGDWINSFTAGRFQEVVAAVKVITNNPSILVTGGGTDMQLNIPGEPDRWYVHSALLTHVLYVGVVPTFVLYFFILSLLVKSFFVRNFTFSMYYSTVLLASTIIGMNIYINPLFWFFLAILKHQVSSKKYYQREGGSA